MPPHLFRCAGVLAHRKGGTMAEEIVHDECWAAGRTCMLCGGFIWRAATREHHRYGKVHLKCYVKLLENAVKMCCDRPSTHILGLSDVLAKEYKS